MRLALSAIEGEYRRYKAMAEAASAQLDDASFEAAPDHGNSAAALHAHVAGNLTSRFTAFLTSDGEKPWRNREAEFAPVLGSRPAILRQWEEGWAALFEALAPLDDSSLGRVVHIRSQPLTVAEALQRSLAHTAFHVGQIVARARSLQGGRWSFLSIPPGQSETYNQSPDLDRPPGP